MTTKDYVYLGLFALASLVCYCHGFYAGVSRTARIYDALLKDEREADDSLRIAGEETAPEVAPMHCRNAFPAFPGREVRSDFGNN